MTTIYLIRHAEAEGNLYRRIHGWYDAKITENGMKQINALEQRFRDVPMDAVYSSDLYRTKTTARAIYLPQKLELRLHPGLREINMGDWEDRPWGEIRQTDGERLLQFNRSDPTWRAPNGEGLGEVGLRMEQTIYSIAQCHPNETIALFSHGTAIRQFIANVRGIAPEDWHSMPHCDNTAVTCLAWDGAAFHVVYEGDNSHLDDSISTLARQSWWRKGEDHKEDVNLWFRPLDPVCERELYLSARRDAWISIHGTALPFDGASFWQEAEQDFGEDPWMVCVAMVGNEPVGILQLSPRYASEEQVGFIAFSYLFPDHRFQGLGVQLLGQAVSIYRGLGRTVVRLRCSANNTIAQAFYTKYGFHMIGTDPAKVNLSLNLFDLYIGY